MRNIFRMIAVFIIFFFSFSNSAFAKGFIKKMSGNNPGAGFNKDKYEAMDVDGLLRTYFIHLPSGYDKNTSYPVVFVFHGGGGSAEGAERMSAMSPKADKEHFIAVYPNGDGKLKNKLLTWNTWNCCGYALKNNINDVKFIRLLIDKLEQEYNADPKRIYATGLSNGGMMSYRLACELSDKIAAIAPVAGALNCDNCRPDFPVAVIAFHGTADKHLPYYGGMGDNSIAPRIDKPVSFAIGSWVKNNGCTDKKKEEFGSIIKDSYGGCKNNADVVLYTVVGGGHSWPGGRNGAHYGNVDKPTHEISATDLIWDFFSRHSK
jgi:polyhydroxybutyrate depolymerase